jgi:hypothetical protein
LKIENEELRKGVETVFSILHSQFYIPHSPGCPVRSLIAVRAGGSLLLARTPAAFPLSTNTFQIGAARPSGKLIGGFQSAGSSFPEGCSFILAARLGDLAFYIILGYNVG